MGRARAALTWDFCLLEVKGRSQQSPFTLGGSPPGPPFSLVLTIIVLPSQAQRRTHGPWRSRDQVQARPRLRLLLPSLCRVPLAPGSFPSPVTVAQHLPVSGSSPRPLPGPGASFCLLGRGVVPALSPGLPYPVAQTRRPVTSAADSGTSGWSPEGAGSLQGRAGQWPAPWPPRAAGDRVVSAWSSGPSARPPQLPWCTVSASLLYPGPSRVTSPRDLVSTRGPFQAPGWDLSASLRTHGRGLTVSSCQMSPPGRRLPGDTRAPQPGTVTFGAGSIWWRGRLCAVGCRAASPASAHSASAVPSSLVLSQEAPDTAPGCHHPSEARRAPPPPPSFAPDHTRHRSLVMAAARTREKV